IGGSRHEIGRVGMAKASMRTGDAAAGGAAFFSAPRLTRRAVVIVGVALAYYVAAKLGLQLALVEKNVTPLWPPTGIAVVALLIFGLDAWPGVALAAFVINAP